LAPELAIAVKLSLFNRSLFAMPGGLSQNRMIACNGSAHLNRLCWLQCVEFRISRLAGLFKLFLTDPNPTPASLLRVLNIEWLSFESGRFADCVH
jgi:hypothetical protein